MVARLLVVLSIYAVVGCGEPPRVATGSPAPTRAGLSGVEDCVNVPHGCVQCDNACTFEAVCPEMPAWCETTCGGEPLTDASLCPEHLYPLFCDGEPPKGACLTVEAPTCAGTVQVYCCTQDFVPLYKKCQVDSDCPQAPNPCASTLCKSGMCGIYPAPDGMPCAQGQACSSGVCL